MSVYSEMLRIALVQDDSADWTVERLSARLVHLHNARDHRGEPVARLGDTLAYDVTVVRLCERLGISHQMLGDSASEGARLRAERLLVAEIPSLGDTLAPT